MARILAVDFGEKRIGLATSDASGTLATPRRTLRRKSDEVVLRELGRFCLEEEIALVVFGVPHSGDGAETPLAARIRSFAAKLAARANLPVRFHAETLTSDEAARRVNTTGSRAELDPVAAAVLLEDYLQSAGSEEG